METCPQCGHEREGHTLINKTVTCSSGHYMGFGDEDMCGCVNPCHAERLVAETRYLS